MTARLDVPALLLEAADTHNEESNKHHYYAQQVPGESAQSHLLRGRDSDDKARFFARLADAVEAYRTAWDRRLNATTHAELMVEMHHRADAVLALLRGEEVEP